MLMKRIFLMAFAFASVCCANAEVVFKSAQEKNGKLEVVMEDDAAGDNVIVTSAKLVNGSKDVFASMMMCGLQDGVATFTLTFPMQKSFDSPKVVLKINDEESVTDLGDSLDKFAEVTGGGSETVQDVPCNCGCL